jgi:OmpA-OmpF porin, OOP family
VNSLRTRLVLVSAALLLATTGCGSSESSEPNLSGLPCPVAPDKPLTVVVGARANSAEPEVAKVTELVKAAAKHSAPIHVIRLDGSPSVAIEAPPFKPTGNNSRIRERNFQNFVSSMMKALADVKPKEPEADVLGALTKAAHATGEGGTIVVLDSGLSTKGQLSFLDSDMFGVDPNEAAEYLQKQQLMPNLRGRTVLFDGLGNTAQPQPELDEHLHKVVVELWETIAMKAGASCTKPLDSTQNQTSIETDKTVSIVPLPALPPLPGCGTTVLRDSGSVGFVPNETVFRDQAAAQKTLQQFADVLKNGRQLVTLTGTTATWGPVLSRYELSKQRADAVRDQLVSLGVDGGRITTVGAGSDPRPDREVDIGPDGSLLPGPAAHNRSVVVDVVCPT